jgi:hypothetical protein
MGVIQSYIQHPYPSTSSKNARRLVTYAKSSTSVSGTTGKQGLTLNHFISLKLKLFYLSPPLAITEKIT